MLLVIFRTSQAPYTPHYPGGISKCNSHFELFLRKTGSEKSRDYRDVIFQKLVFKTVFSPYGNKNPVFLNSSRLKSDFEKLRFREGLVWTAGVPVGIKLRFRDGLVFSNFSHVL